MFRDKNAEKAEIAQARSLCERAQLVSIGLIQREMRVGYARAAELATRISREAPRT